MCPGDETNPIDYSEGRFIKLKTIWNSLDDQTLLVGPRCGECPQAIAVSLTAYRCRYVPNFGSTSAEHTCWFCRAPIIRNDDDWESDLVQNVRRALVTLCEAYRSWEVSEIWLREWCIQGGYRLDDLGIFILDLIQASYRLERAVENWVVEIRYVERLFRPGHGILSVDI
jgi:hypothetical protein